MKIVVRIASCLLAAVSVAAGLAAMEQKSEVAILLEAQGEAFDVVKACDALACEIQAGKTDRAVLKEQLFTILRRIDVPLMLVKRQDGKIEKMLRLNMELSKSSFAAVLANGQKYQELIGDLKKQMTPHEFLHFLGDIVQIFEEKVCVGFTPTMVDLFNFAPNPDIFFAELAKPVAQEVA